MDIKIKGIREWEKRWKRMQDKLDGRIGGDLLQRGVAHALTRVQATSRAHYLTGPRPLKLGVVTGRLRSSILVKTKRRGRKVEGSVGTDVSYAITHELLGHGRKKILRPFLSPAFKDNLAKIKEDISEALRKCYV